MSRVSVLISLILASTARSSWGEEVEEDIEDIRFNFAGVGEVEDEDQAKRDLFFELDGHDETRRQVVEEKMRAMYKSLPKNGYGNLGHQAVRYALHRYFISEYDLFIRGLEPEYAKWTPVSLTDGTDPHVMSEWVPNLLQGALEARVGDRGVDLHDLSAMATTIYGFIDREAMARLELSYEVRLQSTKGDSIDLDTAEDIMWTYLESYMTGGNFDGRVGDLNKEDSKESFRDTFSDSPGLTEFLEELINSRLQNMNKFEDMKDLVREIGVAYGKFSQDGCQDIKKVLKNSESRKPGRVRLSVFYNISLNSPMQFIEAADYLQSLGELDVTEPASPYVIIANYLTGRQNCQDISSIYALCCRNACEDFMSDLEVKIGSATSTYEVISQFVASFTMPSDPAPRELSPELLGRLREVSELHAGNIPLHSRLFSQWMHHVYPLECPFPHEPGSLNPQSVGEWMQEGGAGATVSEEDRQKYVDSDSCAVDWEGKVGCAQENTDIPWSMAEEHFAGQDHMTVSQPSQRSSFQVFCGAVFLALGVVLLLTQGKGLSSSSLVRFRQAIAKHRYISMSLVFLCVCAYLIDLIDGSVFAVGVVGVLALNWNFCKNDNKKCDELPMHVEQDLV